MTHRWIAHISSHPISCHKNSKISHLLSRICYLRILRIWTAVEWQTFFQPQQVARRCRCCNTFLCSSHTITFNSAPQWICTGSSQLLPHPPFSKYFISKILNTVLFCYKLHNHFIRLIKFKWQHSTLYFKSIFYIDILHLGPPPLCQNNNPSTWTSSWGRGRSRREPNPASMGSGEQQSYWKNL